MIYISSKMTYLTQKTYEDLSKMVVWHRKKGKITQKMLADLAGISRTALQRLESGNTTIQLDTLWKVLNILNIKLAYTSPLMSIYMSTLPIVEE